MLILSTLSSCAVHVRARISLFIPIYPATRQLPNAKKAQERDRCACTQMGNRVMVTWRKSMMHLQKGERESPSIAEILETFCFLKTYIYIHRRYESLQDTHKTLVVSSAWTGIAEFLHQQQLGPNSPCPELHCWLILISMPPARSQQQPAKISALVSVSYVLNVIPIQIHQTIYHRSWNIVGKGIHIFRNSWKNPSAIIVNSCFVCYFLYGFHRFWFPSFISA